MVLYVRPLRKNERKLLVDRPTDKQTAAKQYMPSLLQQDFDFLYQTKNNRFYSLQIDISITNKVRYNRQKISLKINNN